MSKQIITNIILNEDEILKKEKVRPKISLPNYYRIGNGTMNKHKIQSIDLIKELVNCSKPAQVVLLWIKDGMVWNPYEEQIDFVVKVVPETSASKRTLKSGFKELSEKNLVRRVKRSHYMINPNAIITDYEKQIKVWSSLDEE